MSLAVIAPMLNEERYVKAWCENVIRYADEVAVMDTGSTDDTYRILARYGVYICRAAERSEVTVRNHLLAWAQKRSDWILRLDADELMIAEDVLALKQELPYIKERFIFVPHLMFWRHSDMLRARQYDRHIEKARQFHPCYLPLFWKNDPRVQYVPYRGRTAWDSRMVYGRWGRIGPRLFGTRREKPAMFHYHFLEHRADRLQADEFNEDGIHCVTYTGPHPEEVKYHVR